MLEKGGTMAQTSQLDFEKEETNFEDTKDNDNKVEGYQSSIDGNG